MRLGPQLRDLLQVPNMAQSLRYKSTRVKIYPDAIEDIYDGEKYKELILPGNFLSNPNNISLKLWTDGIQLTKSSPATSYPVVLEVNGFLHHVRKKHHLLGGIWVANEHPILNTILLPIVRDLRTLHEVGISWKPNGLNEVTTKVLTTIFTADSVARPAA